jgi:hypothetical protein
MAMPDEMGLDFTPTELTDIKDHFTGILTIINGKKIVQLTDKERQGAQSASETRLPYMDNGINNLATTFSNLQPGFLSLVKATADIKTAFDFREIDSLRNEVNDRMIDFAMASEHFAYQYMRAFYDGAKTAQAVNTPGADVVVNALAPLFEGQGVQPPVVPTP